MPGDPASIEEELAAQPSPSAEALAEGAPRGLTRPTVIAVLTAVLAGGALLVLNTISGDAVDALDQSNAALSSLAGSVAMACDQGAVRPDPAGVNACARAQIAESGGVLDGPRIAATLQAVIAANPPAVGLSPPAVAERARPLLPELDENALAAITDAQVAAAQGAAAQRDVDAVTDDSAPAPRPTAPGPPIVSTAPPSQPDPAPDPAPEPDGPTAVGITFERAADGSCQAVTRFDDDTQSTAPADDASCPAASGPPASPDATPDPPLDPSTSNPGSSTSSPSDPADPTSPTSETVEPDGAPPVIRVR